LGLTWSPSPCTALRTAVKAAEPALRRLAITTEEGLSALAHILLVVSAHVLVADTARQFAQRLFEFRALFRGIEHTARSFAQPQELGKRARAAQHFAKCLGAAVLHQVIRVLALGQERETQRLAGLNHRQRQVSRPP